MRLLFLACVCNLPTHKTLMWSLALRIEMLVPLILITCNIIQSFWRNVMIFWRDKILNSPSFKAMKC